MILSFAVADSVGFTCLGGVNAMIILVGLGQLVLSEKEAFKAVTLSMLKIAIHADGFKGADLDTYLAPHADRDINIKGLGLKLHFA